MADLEQDRKVALEEYTHMMCETHNLTRSQLYEHKRWSVDFDEGWDLQRQVVLNSFNSQNMVEEM